MKRSMIKNLVLVFLALSFVVISFVGSNSYAARNASDKPIVLTNLKIGILIPSNSTSSSNYKTGSFLNELKSFCNANVITVKQLPDYLSLLKEHKCVLLVLGNKSKYMNYFKKAGINTEDSEKSFHFKKVTDIGRREIVKESGYTSPTLYCIAILGNGVVCQFEQASNSGVLLNNSFKDWLKGINASFGSKQKQTIGSGYPRWVVTSEKTKDYSYYPYGEIQQTADFYKLYNDNSSSYDWYAIHTFNSTIPGNLIWDSGYQTNNLTAYHSYKYANGVLTKWGPTTTNTNTTVTVNVGVSAGENGASVSEGLSWAVNIPDVMVYDETIPSEKEASWNLQYRRDSASAWNTYRFEPGSQFRVPDGYNLTMSPCQTTKFTKYHFYSIRGQSMILELTDYCP